MSVPVAERQPPGSADATVVPHCDVNGKHIEVGGPFEIELPAANKDVLVTENTGGCATQQEYGASQKVY